MKHDGKYGHGLRGVSQISAIRMAVDLDGRKFINNTNIQRQVHEQQQRKQE